MHRSNFFFFFFHYFFPFYSSLNFNQSGKVLLLLLLLLTSDDVRSSVRPSVQFAICHSQITREHTLPCTLLCFTLVALVGSSRWWWKSTRNSKLVPHWLTDQMSNVMSVHLYFAMTRWCWWNNHDITPQSQLLNCAPTASLPCTHSYPCLPPRSVADLLPMQMHLKLLLLNR